MLRHRRLPPPSSSSVYELTERGLELEQVLAAIGRWGARSPALPDSDTLGVDTFVLGLRATFDREAARGHDARYELRVGEDVFELEVVDGALSRATRGFARPDLVVTVDPTALFAVSRGTRTLGRRADERGGHRRRGPRRLLRVVPSPIFGD